MKPLFPFLGRRPARVALLVGLLGWILTSAFVWAQPTTAQPPPAVQPAQAGGALYLPLLISPEPPAPAGAPQLDSFTISSAAGPMAAEVELRWRVRGATSLTIEPDVGDVRGGASAQVYPLATTTYTLTASNAKGSVTATVAYTVNALPTPNPLTVVATADAARASSASIGAAGGTLEATGADGTRYTLSVPPEALLYTEAITLTPVAAIAGMPFAASAVRAVSIAPEGLLFIEPATLTITPPAAPAEPMVGFAFQGAGAEFHLRRLENATALTVVTARSYGVALTPDRKPLAAARAFPSDRMDALAHLLATITGVSVARGVAMVPQPSDSDDDLLAPLFDAAYVFDVRPELQNAVQNPDRIDLAAQMYITWRSLNRDNEDTFRNHITEANLLLGEALRKAGELATERCNAGRPEQGFALQRYMGYAKRFGLVNTRAALEERLKKCWVFELIFQSRIDEKSDPFIVVNELKATLQLRYIGGRLVGSGPLNWERFTFDHRDPECTAQATTQGSTFDAASSELGLSLEPVSRTSPNVRLSLKYNPGEPVPTVTITCSGQESPVTMVWPTWRFYYGELHQNERWYETTFTLEAEAMLRSFPGWVYDQNLPGEEVYEHTEITLEHKPEN